MVPLPVLREQIIHCTRCPRLRAHCERVAREKKRAYLGETYWGLPIPGFGDPDARLLVIGLAPGAHGANRTGRIFTGDSSGDFLMRVMHRVGFANIPTSTHAGDGLHLLDAFIAASARCAPPDNKPVPAELEACFPWLRAEAAALPNVRVMIALGRIAFDSALRLLAERGAALRPRPLFAHGAVYQPGAPLPTLIASYHPSRQNTNTGRLTQPMFEAVFTAARRAIDESR